MQKDNREVNVVEDISNRIINRNEENNNNAQNIYRKNNNKNKNNNIQLNENDIREYALEMPVKSNKIIYYLLFMNF